MQRGEVWSVSLPFASSGREQSGQRPAVVVQDDVYGQGSALVLIVPLTSQTSALRFPATVLLQPTAQNGLSVPSVAMVFQIRALDRTRFVRRSGILHAEEMESLLAEFDYLTGR